MKVEVIEPIETQYVRMGDMKSGDIGIVENNKTHACYNGSIVIKNNSSTQNEVLQLGEKKLCWVWDNYNVSPDLKVRLFPKGTKITLTVE